MEQTYFSAALHEPVSVQEATNSPESSKWVEAMENEMRALESNEVWDLVQLPPGKTPVGSKLVFKLKAGADGSVERYKARLVAQGHTQKYRSDYDETFSPVIRQESLRVLIALSV